MQKILIGVNCELHYSEEDFATILGEVYGHSEEKYYWMDLFIRNHDEINNLRVDEKLHQVMIERNFVVGRDKYENEDRICKIVEIPDGVEWTIKTYDCDVGEYIREKHRTWN